MATSAQINSITALYAGYFDRAPDPAGLQFWINEIDNGRAFNTIAADFAASPEATALYPFLTTPGVSSPASFIATIYTNLFNRAPDALGLTYWTDVLADGSVSVADMIEAIINGARDDATATPPTFDKATLDNKVEVGLYFATETGNIPGFTFDAAAKAAAVEALNGVTNDDATVAAGQAEVDAYVAGGVAGDVFTLTDSVDSPTATANNDTFIGVIDAATPANSTLTAADTVNGLSGSDTLKVTTTGIAAAAVDVAGSASISSVETVEIRAVHTGAFDATLAGTNVPGLTLVNNALSTNNVTLTALNDATAIKVTGNGTATNGNTTATYAAAATSGELTVDAGVTAGVTAGAIAVNGAGLTSLAITSSGAANTTGAISTTGTPTSVTIDAKTALTTTGLTVGTNASAQSLTISGAGAVTLGALDADFATVDASGNSGGVTATLNNLVTGTTTGGTGNDSFTTAAILTTGSVDAGDGTDTLTIAASAHLTAVTGAKYTNFEILGVADGVTVDLDNIAGITAVTVNDASNAATIVNDMSATQAGAVTLTALEDDITLNVKGATTINQLDTLNITIDDGDTTLSETISTTGGTITSAGVETLEIVAVDDADIADVSAMGALTGVTLSGAGDHSFATAGLAANGNTTINASTATGTVTIDASGASVNGLALTGSATGVNTLTGSNQDDVMVGGAAVDSITGGTGDDKMTGGGGADTFVIGAAGSIAGTDLDMIADFNTGGSDIIDFGAVGIVLNLENNGVTATSDVDTTVGGKIVFATADDTYAEKVIAIQADTELDAIGSVAFFEDSGNSYVYYAGAATVNTDDQIVELTGVTGLSTISISGNDLTIA